MSLRLRLFLLFGGLVALLVLAQWWWVRTLTRDLSSELDEVASSVGRSVAAFFTDRDGEIHHKVIECRGGDCEEVTGQEGELTEHLEEDVLRAGDRMFVRKIRRPAAGPAASEAGASEQGAAEPGRRFAYEYEVEDRVLTEGEPAEQAVERIEKHVRIHVEHEDGERYLWMGSPSSTRRFQIPHRGLQDKLERFSQRMVLGSVGFLALGLMLAGVVAHRVTTPLRRLSDAARQVGEGALGTRVPVSAEGEVGEAIRAFNRMSGRLEELDERSRELEARKHLGEIGEIARGLAHTLRNPLNALGLSVEELAAEASGDAAPELADSARRQIRRIDQSIRSFLALASQSGGVAGEIDLGELIQDVGLEALQDGRGRARLDLDLEEDLPRLAAVEPELRAVLQALVVNAVEASPEGGRVTVRASAPAPGRWRVEIEDEGPGLAPEVRRRLFTPHLSTKANGSGMGLFLAHRITTNRYGGSLELVDRGSSEDAVGGTRAVLELGERATIESEGGDG